MSNFSGLSIAASGLRAHRRRLDVIGENIANVDTPGYHRQRVQLSAINTSSVGLFSGSAVTEGGGVEYTAIKRIKDATLELHAREQAGVAADRSRRADLLQRLEQAVGGLDDGGVYSQINDLLNSFDDLANSPESLAIRQVVLQRAESLAQGFSRTSEAMDQLREREVLDLFDTVDQVNVLTSQIAHLDGEILASTNFDAEPNALLDERDSLVAELSTLVDTDITEFADGQLGVSIDGQLVVSNGRSTPLAVQVETDPALAPLGFDRVSVVNGNGRVLDIESGELAAILESTGTTIPDQRRDLDAVIADLVTQVNAQHAAGAGLDGTTGSNLLEIGTGSGRLIVSADVAGQPEKLAAAAAGGGALDDANARAIAQLAEDPTGPPNVFANSVGELAARVATANGVADAADAASAQAASLALSVGGVSLDEEMTDLITTQRAFEASARMVTVIDEMLNTIVNGTGLVGR